MNGEAFNLLAAQRSVFASAIPAPEKLVALALLDHTSRSTETFPGLDRLAAWTSLDRRTVIRMLASLERRGAVVVRRQTGRANRYELGQLTSLPVSEDHGCQPITSDRETPHPCHTITPTRVTRSPEVTQGSNPTRNPGIGARDGSPTKEAKPKRAKLKAAEVALPADWKPTEEHQAFAAKHGLALDLEAVAFKGHFEGRTAASWNGRFATWLANQAKWNRDRGPRRAPAPQRGVLDESKAQSWGKAGAADLLGGAE